MDEKRPQDETKVGMILVVGLAGAFLTTAIVILLAALFVSARAGEEARKASSGPAPELAEFIGDAEERLATYGWVDREKGIARIPVDRAVELLLAEAAGKGGGK